MSRAQGLFQGESARTSIAVALVMAFVCSAFAAAASWVVAAMYFAGAFAEAPGFGLKILVKACVFTIGAALSLWMLSRARVSLLASSVASHSAPHASRWGFLPAGLLAAALLFSHLSHHPWPAPDELHHLIVARNLAEHGAYASGLAPDFVWFDRYDSVGAPVIGLVAASFKVFGAGIASARGVLAVFGVVLMLLVYFVFLPVYGARASALASVFALAAFGTLYLSRSLYGEVPALAFVLLGLLVWRRGLRQSRAAWLLAAGVCFGLAILTKAFMVVAALAVVGVYVFDGLSYRKIAPRGILLPALGTFVVLGIWQAVEMAAQHLMTEDKPSLALYYRHSLTFGLDAIGGNVTLIATAIPALLLGVAAITLAVPKVFRQHYDPAIAVLILMAPLFVFWFAFFTPMHLPRYLWYPAVIAAMLCGSLVDRILALPVAPRAGAYPYRSQRLAIAALFAWVYLVPAAETTYKIFAADQAGPDREMARFVSALPADARIATTYWPAERLLNFLDERRVTVLSPGMTIDFDVIIDSDRAEVPLGTLADAGTRFGHYVVYRRGNSADHVARLPANP